MKSGNSDVKNRIDYKDGINLSHFSSNLATNPRISIITVVFNDVSAIEATIKSIINQTYDNLEYIIIDGGSTDGTLEIVNRYRDKIDFLVSQKDNGIYDAMNKGLLLATGQWVNFMNCGDYFYSANVLEKIHPEFNSEHFLIAGGYSMFWHSHAVDIDATPHRIGKMLSSHQAIFFNAQYAKLFPYNTKYKVGADYDVVCRMFFDLNSSYALSSIRVVRMNAVGYAGQNFLTWLNDYRLIIKSHYSSYNSNVWTLKAVVSKYFPFIANLITRRKVIR